MGAKISRFTDSINKRRRRFSRSGSGDDSPSANVHSNGSLETGHDPAVHGASLDDRNYNNESFKKRDVDPSDPQQNTAATKIQTQYRQHSAKAEVEEIKEELAATRIQAGFRGYLDREQVRDMKTKSDGGEDAAQDEDEVDIDLEDPDVEKAAIKIQAGFKGFKARKEIQEKTEPSQNEETKEKGDEEEVDIDLGDPEVQKAALKIQTGFRGHRARKDVTRIQESKDTQSEKETDTSNREKTEKERNNKKEEEKVGEAEEEVVDIDLEDPDVGKAALKIQAGFKGLKARKEIAMKKTENVAKDDDGPSRSKTSSNNEEARVSEELADIDLKDPDLAKVTLKLQAGFRGFKSRKKTKETPKPGSQSPASGNAQAAGSDERKAVVCEEITKNEPIKMATTTDQEDDELKDIDLKDPDLGKAVLKIQAGFRLLKSRKKAKPSCEERLEKAQEETVEATIPPEDEEVDIDLNDPDVEKAAVKIQAGFKGFKARQKVVKEKEPQEPAQEETTQQETEGSSQQKEEEIDIDLEDPDTEKAALKIQAGFRGYQTRKDLTKNATSEGDEAEPKAEAEATETAEEQAEKVVEIAQPAGASAPEEEAQVQEEEEVVDIDLNDPEVEKAATKIQAGFKGFKTRKEVQQRKEQELGQAGEGETGEGQADEGQADEGQAGEGQADEGQSGEGQADEGQAGEDQVDAMPDQAQVDATEDVPAAEEGVPQGDGEGQGQPEAVADDGQTEQAAEGGD